MGKIYLLRHAEAEGNVYRRCHGQYDSLNTPRAEAQIAAVAKRFKDIPIKAVYTSDLKRARHTAVAIAREHGLPLIYRRDIREIAMGEWEDLPWGLLPREYAEGFEIWEKRPWECDFMGGETSQEVIDRMTSAIKDIASQIGDDAAVVVSHGMAMRLFLCKALSWPLEKIKEVGWCDNTAVSLVEVLKDGSMNVVFRNDNSHLSEESSTLGKQKWWRPRGAAAQDFNTWFRKVDLYKDEKMLEEFGRSFYESAYGSDDGFDKAVFMRQIGEASYENARAVTFANLSDEIVGLVFLDPKNGARKGSGLIRMLCLKNEYRGIGLGTQLIGQAVSVYREMGLDRIYANVSDTNENAAGFYENAGFQRKESENRHTVYEKTIKIGNDD